MSYKFSTRSLMNLGEVHSDLQAVMHLAIKRTPVDFAVIDGKRTLEEQKALVAKGKSKTMNSRHLTGHAVDVVPWLDGRPSWDWSYYNDLAPVIKDAADELAVPIEWGGDWKTFKDGPHWQLPWNEYAADDLTPRAEWPKLEPERDDVAVFLRQMKSRLAELQEQIEAFERSL